MKFLPPSFHTTLIKGLTESLGIPLRSMMEMPGDYRPRNTSKHQIRDAADLLPAVGRAVVPTQERLTESVYSYLRLCFSYHWASLFLWL